jgi:F-type H+-transporting ATPase subunit c
MITDLILMAQEAASHAATAAAAAPAGLTGNLGLGFAGLGAGVGVGLVGLGATQSVGRNPGAFGNILTIAIIGMAFAEAIAIYALVLAFR